jgi:hypothetical protein
MARSLAFAALLVLSTLAMGAGEPLSLVKRSIYSPKLSLAIRFWHLLTTIAATLAHADLKTTVITLMPDRALRTLAHRGYHQAHHCVGRQGGVLPRPAEQQLRTGPDPDDPVRVLLLEPISGFRAYT